MNILQLFSNKKSFYPNMLEYNQFQTSKTPLLKDQWSSYDINSCPCVIFLVWHLLGKNFSMRLEWDYR